MEFYHGKYNRIMQVQSVTQTSLMPPSGLRKVLPLFARLDISPLATTSPRAWYKSRQVQENGMDKSTVWGSKENYIDKRTRSRVLCRETTSFCVGKKVSKVYYKTSHQQCSALQGHHQQSGLSIAWVEVNATCNICQEGSSATAAKVQESTIPIVSAQRSSLSLVSGA